MNLNIPRAAIRHTGILILSWLFCLVYTISSPAVNVDPKLRVALFVDGGASPSEFKKEFKNSDDIVWTTVDGEGIREGVLKHFDALVVPGGRARAEAASMGAASREEVRRFVHDGGVYMGVCAGAYLASQARDVYLGLVPLKTLDQEHWYRVDEATPLNVELTPAGMEIFGIKNKNIRILYENGPVFAPLDERLKDSLASLGFFRSEVVADGGKPGLMLGAPAMILSKYGQGLVLAISPHPEETRGLKTAEVHALHWLYEHRKISRLSALLKNSDNTINTREFSGSQFKSQLSVNHAKTDTGEDAERSYGSKLGEEAVNLASSIFDRARIVSYSHREVSAGRQVVIDQLGRAEARTDCSGFISYVVHAIAPVHYQIIRAREPGASYPQAKIWARFFDTLDSNQATDGWLGIRNWHELKPGDIIAWVKGASTSKANTNTGHVMLVMGKPSAIKQERGFRFIEVPVIDSSTTYHFAPERLPPNAHQSHRNGLGLGLIRIILSETGAPIGYWAGTYWGEGQEEVNNPTLSNVVRFARMMSNEKS